jgi:hypothetical protein
MFVTAIAAAGACHHVGPASGDAGAPDADSDSDTDVESDTETETETETDTDTEPEYCPHDLYYCVPEGMCTSFGGTVHEPYTCSTDYVCCDWEPDTDTTPGGVHGTVHYLWSGDPAGDFDVEARDQESNVVGTDVSDEDGHYGIELPSDLYDLRAMGWFIYGSVSNIPVPAGVWVEVDIPVTDSD